MPTTRLGSIGAGAHPVVEHASNTSEHHRVARHNQLRTEMLCVTSIRRAGS
jgi:hypothetical protein